MADNPLIKRYLDAGMAFTQLTRERAEALVNDLVRAGEAQADRTEELVNDLIEQTRRNTEALLELVRNEVRNQLVSLGLLDADGTPTRPAATTTKKSGAKKSAAKKSGAKKSAARKSAKKAATRPAGS